MTLRTFWMSLGISTLLLGACGDDDRPTPVDGGGGDAVVVDSGPPECPAGTMMCGDSCVDTVNSRFHCGGCDIACGAGEACIEGACAVVCPVGQDECEGRCVDTATDRANCGACGASCASGEVCLDSSCEVSCPAGQELCGTICVDTQSNPGFCGACDNVCDAGEVCSEGLCAASCGAGLMDCSGACIDTNNDPANCGACDNTCTDPAGGSGLCMAGTCRSVCDPLFGDCNADVGTDGCETPLATDPSNCGACGRVCSLPSAVTGCVAGACVVATCDPGAADCDSLPANGCETNTISDATNCGGCGVTCTTGQGCYGATCRSQGTGEDCSSPWYLTDGLNTVAWTATGAEYITANPSCLSTSFGIEGPDLVLAYTASLTGSHTVVFDKPTSTRWVAVVSSGACGTLTPELACITDFSPATMGGSFTLTAGETAYIYVRDTSSGTLPLSNPMTVTVTSPTTPATTSCVPGTGGVVGTTTAAISTGLSSFTEYSVAADNSATGYVYVGGLSDLYRIPKAGGTAEDLTVVAGLTAMHLGYGGVLIDGANIYVLESATSGVNGRLWRISSDGGTTWSVRDYAHFPMEPEDDFRGATVHDGRIYLVTEEDTSTVDTQIWSVNAAASTLPAIAVLEATVTGESDCFAIARDSSFYYLVCDDGGDRLVRVPVVGGAPELITSEISVNTTNASLFGDDLDADGRFDVLYVQTDREEVYYVCDPAGSSPAPATLVSFGTGTSNYGLGFDAVNKVLWMFDDDTQELVSIQ